jgi:hypothetical protein
MTTFCIAFYESHLTLLDGQQLCVMCRRSLLIWVCVAMLQLVADDLLQNDFASNMKLLQVNFPCVSVFRIRIRRIRFQFWVSWIPIRSYVLGSGSLYLLNT